MEQKIKKGTLESDISKALTQWEKDFLGRGSVSVKTDIIRDMIIVCLNGVLTPAEYKLCETMEGRLSIKKNRQDLVETGCEHLTDLIKRLTSVDVISFHTDISTKTGERVIVFKLNKNLENKLI
ncbi:DUF2294 domain-containing protein [Alkalibacillus aidingensis]|uniref:DUF2294 domain-containing protein n=1 Tax=Alkalibacillus aidingensis TaxID=2747607 RepID=UPI0016604415|nr:DUF2294 domain-containing protein [Alkalibacillus aidingensis]